MLYKLTGLTGISADIKHEDGCFSSTESPLDTLNIRIRSTCGAREHLIVFRDCLVELLSRVHVGNDTRIAIRAIFMMVVVHLVVLVVVTTSSGVKEDHKDEKEDKGPEEHG